MVCKKVKGENGKVVAVACGSKCEGVEEWEKMCRELEKRLRLRKGRI